MKRSGKKVKRKRGGETGGEIMRIKKKGQERDREKRRMKIFLFFFIHLELMIPALVCLCCLFCLPSWLQNSLIRLRFLYMLSPALTNKG